MGISGISDYSNFFRNYAIPQIPVADTTQQKAAEVQKDNRLQQAPSEQFDINNAPDTNDINLSVDSRESGRRANIDIEDISLTFNTNENFEYIGRDSDIADLDMQKAISDMKKDHILHQYQYFVGGSENFTAQRNSEDGMFFLKF